MPRRVPPARPAGTATRRGTTGYTTVLKILQIMTDKGLVARDERQRTHVYRAARARHDTQRTLVRHLLDRAFGGAAHQLVLHALDAARSSPQELAEIRKLLAEVESQPQTTPSPHPPPHMKGA
jgi:predicted transcriptional regulator